MRLLYARTDLFRGGPDRRRQGQDGGGNPRADERQYLSLRRLFQHRRGHSAGDEPAEEDGPVMINFHYTRVGDVTDAVRQTAGETTAKFIAGGTNLLDLMKLDVERPTKLIDISRLPLNRIQE